jgi:hypothetical protein
MKIELESDTLEYLGRITVALETIAATQTEILGWLSIIGSMVQNTDTHPLRVSVE